MFYCKRYVVYETTFKNILCENRLREFKVEEKIKFKDPKAIIN